MTVRPLSLGRFGRGPSLGGAGPVVLAARYVSGGMEWQESAVTLSTTADGHYLRGGELLVPESDMTVGTTISGYRPWPTNAGVIVGTPSTGRGVGLDAIDDDNYGLIAASSSSMSVLMDFEITGSMSGTKVFFIGTDNTKWRWGFVTTSALQMRVRLYNPANSIVAEVVLADNFQIGDRVQLFATVEWDGASANLYGECWGRANNSGTDSAAAADELMGSYYFGRSVGTGVSLGGSVTIHQVAAWDGVVKTPAEGDAMVAAIQAGGLIGDTVALDAPVQVRGITAGFYDESSPTWLPEITGTGAPVYAEDIASPMPITVPAVYRPGNSDDYLKTLANVPTLPSEGTIIVATDFTAVAGNSNFLNIGLTSTGGMALKLTSGTDPDRFSGTRCGRSTACPLSGMTPDQDNIASCGVVFMVYRWRDADSLQWITGVQSGASINSISSPYINAHDGATTIMTWFSAHAGEMSFAILDEFMDLGVLAPLLTDLYSPRNVGLSRGTLWYSPSFAVADGVDLSTADDVVNLGSAANDVGAWEIVAGTARLKGAS